ncbi:hypothetical protein ES703_111637 [subsurface metagenome]
MVDKEEETQEVEAEETEGVEPETEETTTAEAKSVPAADELKVVIVIKADSILMGVQSPNCDPVYKTMKGTLAAAVKQITGLVREAKQKWSTAPKYPKADLPEPPPRPVTTRTREPDKPKQPTFF